MTALGLLISSEKTKADMTRMIAIRKEDKNKWERRTPLVPKHVKELLKQHELNVIFQPSKIRAYSDQQYENVGARVQEDLSPASVVLAIKEIPQELFERGKTYVFFSHTIKGQKYNMPMLKKLMKKKCQLIDYEKVTDEKGRRLLGFGRYAGLAGMIDSLWALGKRLDWEGQPNVFSEVERAYYYESLQSAKRAISGIGQKIKRNGLPRQFAPAIFGIAGYGHVSKGAQEIVDLLPTKELPADKISDLCSADVFDSHCIYKVVFKEKDMVEPRSDEAEFELQDYYDHPRKYRSRFSSYLDHLSLLINAIYWEEHYPRLVTERDVKQLYKGDSLPRLKVIGDISCDIEGAVEVTVCSTEPGEPVFVYSVDKQDAEMGYQGKGPVVLAVDNLPCEFPRESSSSFSEVLKPFVPDMAFTDYSKPFSELDLPPEIKRSVILHKGELTPDYQYLKQYI